MRKRPTLFILCCILVSITIVWVARTELSMEMTAIFSSNQLYCYWSRSNGIIELGQGEWDKAMLVPSRCVFFHVTTCSKPSLTPRQACAVESAARNNHNLNIFLLFLATDQFTESSMRLVNILESYSNVYIRRIRLSTYVADTPIKNWFLTANWRSLENQDSPRKDFHDYIQMLTLWKFGGIALNLDSVVQTRLDELTTFAGVQDNQDLNVGVFGVDASTDFGRKFIDASMEIVKSTNMNNYLQFNITRFISESVRKLCYQQDTFNKECRQFTIYPPEKFYPVPLKSWRDYFDESKTEKTMKIIENATTIHLWNDHSQNTKTKVMTAYAMTAKKNCPIIYKHFADIF